MGSPGGGKPKIPPPMKPAPVLIEPQLDRLRSDAGSALKRRKASFATRQGLGSAETKTKSLGA